MASLTAKSHNKCTWATNTEEEGYKCKVIITPLTDEWCNKCRQVTGREEESYKFQVIIT